MPLFFISFFVFYFCTHAKEIIDMFPHLKKKKKTKQKTFNIIFLSDTVKVKSFSLCMITTLIGGYIFILGMMTLTLL